MKIRLQGGLPYIAATLSFGGQEITLEDIVVDTGSAGSVFSADALARLGVLPEPDDIVHRVRGVGGFEFVYSKRLEALMVGDLEIKGFEIQVGAMDYGFPLQGLIGTDFLLATRARA